MSTEELKQLMINEIKKSQVLNMDRDLDTAKALTNSGFYTAAFLQYWLVTEVAAKELMSITKYSADCVDATSKSLKTLKKHLKAINSELNETQLKQDLNNNFVTLFKAKAELSCRNLDVAVITKCLTTIGAVYNNELLHYLLATKITALPVGIDLNDKATVRERRNQLVHRNGQVSETELMQLVPVFQNFFGIIRHLKSIQSD